VEILSNYPLIVIFVGSIAALTAVSEIGHRLGLRDSGEANVSTLEASALGLLALMLGFTFAMALTRFDERRDGVLNEANSIGTAALRAGLLPAPHGAESLKLFRDYVQIRLDVARHATTPVEFNAAIARSNEIQAALWRQAKAAMEKNNAMAPTGLYIQALNETFDNQEKRLTAFRTRVPNIVLLALYGIAIIAIGFAAYASGLERRRWRLPVYVMAFLVAVVILLIQDIDRPSAGFVSVSQQPMIDAANVITNYSVEFEQSPPRHLR
jgi:hypothetical protein